ncbi:hypothetical protein FPJ77_09975 [Mycobacterium tuberculosis]|nr:hypothetical protein FPJ77_09975 [Mycobacterium tuberculosis]
MDPIEVAIERRRTNRRVRFRGPPLSQGELGALSAEATGIDGIQLHWFDSPETRKQILRLVRLAETERLNRPGMSGDSSSWKGWGHVRWFIEEVPAGAA